MTGKTVSHYKILEKLGEGGMGVVYKAEDTKLKRTVALKFLTPQALGGEEEKSRFVHEAQAAASLNHPNICTVYEIDESEGQTFIAMEYVDGRSLKAKIESGPLKLSEATDIAVRIAQGLKEAHERGIVHRDIKPANIMLTGTGEPKIMDFGLAKSRDRTQVTKAGTTLGTVAYMSPEQARGERVDRRTDIWSLGVLLYEMISGRLPFKGDYEPAVVYSILNEEPEPLTAVRTGVPVELERVTAKLLAKDSAARYQHVDEVPVDLGRIDLSGSSISMLGASTPGGNAAGASADPAAGRRRVAPEGTYARSRVVPWSLALVLMGAAAIVGGLTVGFLMRTPPAREHPPARFAMTFPETVPLDLEYPVVCVSPDGRRLIYVGDTGPTTQLFLRELDDISVKALPGTKDADEAFFSPDGNWIGFFAGGELKKLYLDGGKPITLCKAQEGAGGSWGPDDTIFFSPAWSEGIWSISAEGGDPVEVTMPGQGSEGYGHWWPEVLPGGDAVLFTKWNTTINDSEVALLSRKTGDWRTLVKGGTYGRYSPTGHLLYAQSGALVAVPFDPEKLEVGRERVPVLEDLKHDPSSGHAAYSLSCNGVLAYVPGSEWLAQRRLVWVDREGETAPLPLSPGAYQEPRLSPDGLRLAFSKTEGGVTNLWMYEFSSGAARQLTFDSYNVGPVWTPDGEGLTFTSSRLGPYSIFQMPSDRSAPEEVLIAESIDRAAMCWGPEGEVLLFTAIDPNTGTDIWCFSTKGENGARPLLTEDFDEYDPVFHPKGKWFAYASNESGRREVSVRPFPGLGAAIPISTGGGRNPLWSRDGGELFYHDGDRVMAVEVETEPEFSAGPPRVLFRGEYYVERSVGAGYDVSADGRFLMVENPEGEASDRLVVHLNWFEELNRLCPSGK
jgi:serine/threonine-protein kinase